MNLQEASRKAGQILYQERAAPTIHYGFVSCRNSALLGVLAPINLANERERYPRQVLEEASQYKFSSVNYTLLQQLLSFLDQGDRPTFFSMLARQIVDGTGCQWHPGATHPFYRGFSSETPLIAEFLARNGATDHLICALGASELELCPALATLVSELGDIVGLNYPVFSDTEYELLSAAIQNVAQKCSAIIKDPRKINREVPVPGGRLSLRVVCQDLKRLSLGIREQCQRARYLYLKNSLLEGINQEINQDKVTVESYLDRLQFSSNLKDALNKADDLYRQGTGFDLKSCMGHLRSFLEMTHLEAAPAMHCKFGGCAPHTWGESIRYMQEKSILSKQEAGFAATLFTLISDMGVHPLIAEREYARLARNMVIEYVLLFLHKIEKLGLRNNRVGV